MHPATKQHDSRRLKLSSTNGFRLDCRAGTVANLPGFPGGKVLFLNHYSRPTKAPIGEISVCLQYGSETRQSNFRQGQEV